MECYQPSGLLSLEWIKSREIIRAADSAQSHAVRCYFFIKFSFPSASDSRSGFVEISDIVQTAFVIEFQFELADISI